MQRYRSGKPDGSVTLKSYGELEAYIYAFHEGRLNLLVVVGPPGTQKSYLFRGSRVPSFDSVVISGGNCSLGVYQAAYRKRDREIILNDIEGYARARRAGGS